MVAAISRRQFLRGDLRSRNAPLRPPWALGEADFIDACDACGACIRACPQRIVRTGEGGFPVLDFSAGECDFCAACAQACVPRALDTATGKTPRNRIAVIDDELCLAQRGVECRSCVDPCESRAIRITYRVGATAMPSVAADACTGCGACYRVCPVHAIAIRPVPAEESV
jgi:ferredoxin-type protein NapF